ncbi:MAG TPA: polymorphic toxin type 46 domain-containing protein, partial [Rheinheimera sp.]|nr:polymorphic toxin type 46 domain-containing protein [Rheinheimera sp.]
EGWGQAPEGNGIGDGGLAATNRGDASSAPVAKVSKPQGGGVAVEQPVPAKAVVHEAAESNTIVDTGEAVNPTAKEIELAKSEGSSSAHIEARAKVSQHFLESNSFSESQIATAIGNEAAGIEGGVDLTKPVEIVSFPPPDEMTQYVKSHGFPGNWFDPTSKQTPDELGLSGEGRTLTSFKMPESQGLLSHSKPIVDNWTNPGNPVSTAGGGKQLFVNDGTKTAVISLNKIGM